MQASNRRARRSTRSTRSTRPTRSTWTPARVRHLRRLLSKGASATRIACELGGGASRNAVLGKVRRLGITALRAHPRRSRHSTRRGNRAVSSHAIPDHLRASRPAEWNWPFPAWIVDARLHADNEPYVDNPGNDADIPSAQRRSLLDLNSRTCRWPVGDPGGSDFFFCGAPPLVGRPYCAEHCARACARGAAVFPRAPGSADVSSALALVRVDLAGGMPALPDHAGEGSDEPRQ
jgi:GcrA cell cycle regulator